MTLRSEPRPIMVGGTESARTPTLRILGTHGVPAAYGGFETAAEHVAQYLAEHGWRVIVYCQADGADSLSEDVWNGIERVHVPASQPGWRGTAQFDLRSIRHASRFRDPCLTFGYNTAIFNVVQRIRGIPNVVNMDGMEWTRRRWGRLRQGILLTNERIAMRVADHLIADHPVIREYLERHAPHARITTITYGADALLDVPEGPVRRLGLEPGGYSTVICRPIPENSLLEIVRAFSARARQHRLVVLGDLDPSTDPYHAEVFASASPEVLFPGAIYERRTVQALRFHCRCYLHGHTVGGTNPSLVEAMAAGNPVVAHDNAFNRWTAGQLAARYFASTDELTRILDTLLDDEDALRGMGTASARRHAEEFTWERVAGQYEALLRELEPGSAGARTGRITARSRS